MRKLFLLLCLCGALAFANILTLDPVLIEHQFQQTTNNPCVIGDPSCNNGTFPMTVLPIASSYDSLSPVYTVLQIETALGGATALKMGYDINQTSTVQTFSLFEMLINGVVVDTYNGGAGTPVPPTVGGGNGNGYADYLIQNFTSLAGYAPTATVQFRAVMPIANDGREEWFVIRASDTGVTPEPLTFSMVGGGLLALGLWRKRLTKR